MKKYMLIMVVALVVSNFAWAQKASEFSIELSATELEVKPGESRDVNVNITRSRGYTKAKAKLGVSSTLPKGISVRYAPANGLINASIATVSVSDDTPAGTYVIVPNCTMNYKSKGALLKLIVAEASTSSTKSNDKPAN
jgi:uncharacterized membrane protein